MPRKILGKCSRRGAAGDALDEQVESNLTCGHCFGHWDLRSRVEFARPWAIHGDEITRRWRAAFPGSRPMAMYILGLVEPPTWKHEWPALRHPLRAIEGSSVEIADSRLPTVKMAARPISRARRGMRPVVRVISGAPSMTPRA